MEDTPTEIEQPQTDSTIADDSQVEAQSDGRSEMARAFDEAMNQLSGGDSETDSENEADTEESPETGGEPASPSSAEASAPQPQSEQALIDRIATLTQQGRLNELPPQIRGQIQAIQRQAIEAEAERARWDETFLELYLENLALKEDDPGEFAGRLLDATALDDGSTKGQSLQEFMTRFAKDHPEVTLDHPKFGPKQKTEADLRAEIGGEVLELLDTTIAEFAQKAGVKNYAEIRDSKQSTLAILEAVAEAAAEAKVATKIDAIRKAERAAALKEAMAEYGKGLPKLPVGAGRTGDPSKLPDKPVSSVAEAYDLAVARSSGN